MKKIFCIILTLIMVSANILCVSAATMYAPDGREAKVRTADVQAWKKVGWYTEPVMTVYASDGRTAVIAKKDYDAWFKVGWHSSPIIKVYAPDGRSSVIKLSDFAAWYKNGWSHSKNYRSVATGLAYREPAKKKRVIAWEGTESKTNVGTTILNRIVPNVSTWSNTDKKEFLSNGSYIEYNLGGRYSLFTGTFAIKKYTGNLTGSMKMKVYADGVEIYSSPTINYKSYPVNFGVRVSGCTILRIKFVPVSGDESLPYYASDFALGDAVIYK